MDKTLVCHLCDFEGYKECFTLVAMSLDPDSTVYICWDCYKKGCVK